MTPSQHPHPLSDFSWFVSQHADDILHGTVFLLTTALFFCIWGYAPYWCACVRRRLRRRRAGMPWL